MKKDGSTKRRFNIKRAVGDVIMELRKATWPTRQETIRLSLLVLGVCIVVGLILGAIDYGFTSLVDKIMGGAG